MVVRPDKMKELASGIFCFFGYVNEGVLKLPKFQKNSKTHFENQKKIGKRS